MKQINIFLLTAFSCFLANGLAAQGSYFGLKGGLTMGTQQWNNYNERDPLFKYHGIVFIESMDETSQFSVFAQAGYHLKGSAIRYNNQTGVFGNTYKPPSDQFIFRNISLSIGGKRRKPVSEKTNLHYFFGLRGDYTINTNLDEFNNETLIRLYYPFNRYVRKWNLGMTLGGGYEYQLGEFVAGNIEVSINPDFSYQYQQLAPITFTNPYGPGNIVIEKTQIRNLTFEVTAGIRFLRKVEYID